jgi:RNA polymerase sigma factor (sigma-70 family)
VSTKSDPQLLREYAGSRSEAAFAELLLRHLDLVHSAALRITGDAHLAQDVSQGVFVALAESAGKLTDRPVLSGWLHRTTRNIAVQAIRTEVRRRHREHQAAAMHESSETAASWDEIAPHLDAALSELTSSDRDAVLLRYFENQSAKDIAAVLGISAEAAQKRVSRAVEKLRENFAKRGITAGVAVLTSTISANAVQAAPAGLGAAIAAGGLAPSAATASGILAMTVLKKALAATAIAALVGTAIHQLTRQAEPAGHESRMPEQASPSRDRQSREDNSVVEQLAKARKEMPPIDRKAELERLKALWMESDVNKGIITREHQKLAKETAGLLSCGREALELVVYLVAHERLIAADVVRDGIADYLASKDDPEARKLLIEMSAENREEMLALRSDPLAWKSAASQHHELLAAWCNAAGRSCSPETLEELSGGLKDEKFAQEARIGYNTQLMRTDPEAAVRAMVNALESKIQSPSGLESIKLLFREELPPDIDFAELECLVPTGPAPGEWRPGDDPFRIGRRALIDRWAKSDPAAAANHVIAHPDRLGTEMMETIIGAYYYQNPTGIVAWISQFPPGPCFDAAAHSAAIYTRSSTPDQTRELILRISDPKLREDALKQLAVPGTNPNTR